jgi:hypothetical protein
MNTLGELRKVDLRRVWENEARHFTPWLADNLQVLGDVLEMELELTTIEAPVGDFALDLLAKDLSGDRLVVIENQLESTDHDHLGKLLTYASGYNAEVVVWVSPNIREEHRQAVDWLNSRTDEETEFFAVVVEAIQIDESLPAVQFRPVAAPNTWRKQKVGAGGGALTPKEQAYHSFFQELIDLLRDQHNFTRARKAGRANWYDFASGIGGIRYSASFAHGGRCRAEVYIDLGVEEQNKELFDHLLAEKDSLETAFGEALEWERLDGKRASRVAVYRPGKIDDESLHSELHSWYVEKLLRFKQIFGDPIAKWVSS